MDLKKVIKSFTILDILIIILVLIFAFFSIFSLFKNQNQNEITVNANGTLYKYSLSQNGTFSVQGELGPTVFEIKDSKVFITDSPCPGKKCLHQKSLPLVCLPNKVIITSAQDKFDGIAE